MDFPYGELETEAPPDFAPPDAWPEYGLIAGPPPFCRREEVGTHPKGIRWSVWPITFEQYTTDEEPDMQASKQGALARNRQIIWHRIRRHDTPAGWRAASAQPYQVDAFRLLADDPTAGWHKNARRDLRLWQEHHENRTHRIERIDLKEFEAGYRASLIGKRLGMDRYLELRSRFTVLAAAPHIELWGVRDLASGRIVGGTGIMHSPSFESSTHMAPFILAEARGIFAATALNYHWFVDAARQGERYAVSTNFWFPGKPKSWKGFSEFKSHFGWKYVAYPPELTRFVRGKLF